MPHRSLPTILLIDDLLGKTWKRVLAKNAKSLVAESALAAEALFANHPEIRLIVMDGCLGGRELNTIHLVREFRKTFKGPMIAASSWPSFCDQLCNAGCNYRVLEKASLPDLVIRLLSEMKPA